MKRSAQRRKSGGPSSKTGVPAQEVLGIRCKGLSATIDAAVGQMTELCLRRNDFGRWNVTPVRLEVDDRLEPGHFRDGETPCKVEVTRSRGRIMLKKRYRGAKFTILESWSARGEEIRWRVEAVLDKGQPERSVRIRQFIPWPTDEPYGWMSWTAQQHFPKMLFHLGMTRIVYGDVCFGMAIPLFTVYDPRADVGLAVAKPFGFRVPQWGLFFDGYRGGGMTVESEHLKLSSDRNATTELMLHPTAGDWRPALGWLFKKYPAHFLPGHPRVSELLEGGYLDGRPYVTPEEAGIAKDYGAKVVEIHKHYPNYGHYFPEKGEWRCADDVHARTTSPTVIRRAIRMFKKKGIQPLLYIQLAGDGQKEYAEQNFPESIALNVDGNRMGVRRQDIWIMNSDPSLPFGKHISREIDRFFKMYPEAGGLFWDQACYDDIDIAHHDGITMVNNKPAYKLVFCYERHRDKLVKKAHKRGMLVSANGPVNIELAAGLDQIMAEAQSWTADVLQYTCIARPLVLYAPPRSVPQAEQIFHKCLLTGATCYMAPRSKFDKAIDQLYRMYAPLLSLLNGREWVLEPDPLTLPDGVLGNIFRGRHSNYYVALVGPRVRTSASSKRGRAMSFDVKLHDVEKVRRAAYWTPGALSAEKAVLETTEGKATVTIANPQAAGIAVLVVK